MSRIKTNLALILAICLMLTSIFPAYAVETPETEQPVVQEEITETETAQQEKTQVQEQSDPEEATPDKAVYEKESYSSETEETELLTWEKEVDGIIITLTADPGVFPDGAELFAERVEDEKTEEAIEEAVEKERDEAASVASSYKFDIKMLVNGEEVQPDTSKGTVKVAFKLAEKVNDCLEVNAYHLKEDAKGKLTAETLDTEVKTVEESEIENAVETADEDGVLPDGVIENDIKKKVTAIEAETDGFSYYVVEFTYDELQYVLPGDSSIKLSAILEALAIKGIVSEASVSNETLFTVEKDEDSDDWTVTAHQAFSSTEKMTVIMDDGNEYEIVVTDDPYVCRIGDTGYATLEAAINDVASGQTITMLQDVSYNDGTDFIINGKTVTIDFDGYSITVYTGYSFPTVSKLFTVSNSGNLTIDNGEIDLSGLYADTISPFTVLGTGSTLKLVNMKQENNLNRLLTIDGGTATIDGGTFGTNNTATKIKLTNNATLKLTNNPTFNCQGNVIEISGTSNTDADTLMGNVTIDSGTFRCTGTQTTGIVALYGKANVTINDGTLTSSNENSAPIFIGDSGYKSSLTINNLTSDSPYVFGSNYNPNIESFTATINDGHFKYTKGKFAIDRGNSLTPNIKLKGGYFGPNTADADALAELTAFCASGYHVETLIASDLEYVNGYRYKIVADQRPDPKPQRTSSSGNTYTFYTGTWNNPVSNGKWTKNADGTWSYSTRYKFTETWGCIADAGKPDSKAWYYFDRNGKMLTGWHKLYWNRAYKWYYFSKTKDADEGKCQLGGITPDGYKVGPDGAWIE